MKTSKLLKARETAIAQVAVVLILVSDWSRGRRELFRPITEKSAVKSKRSWLTFDAHLKISLTSNKFWFFLSQWRSLCRRLRRKSLIQAPAGKWFAGKKVSTEFCKNFVLNESLPIFDHTCIFGLRKPLSSCEFSGWHHVSSPRTIKEQGSVYN